MQLIAYRTVRLTPGTAAQVHAWLHGHQGVRITSGYRSPETNRRVGGSPNSYHLRGRAVDVVAGPELLKHLRQTAKKYGAVEVILESDHLHVAF